MPVTLTFLGAAGTVTGSKFLLESGGERVLVDCGMFQGERQWRRRNWESLAVDPATIGTVVITHAHLDHSGFLPRLVRDGFTGDVLCSPGTARLMEIVLRDAAHLQEEEAEYARRSGYSRHEPPLPVFDTEDVERALRLIRPIPFDVQTPVATCGSVVLRPAGHILGSAFAELRIGGTGVTFSGDLGRDQHPLLRAPARPSPTDTVVVESTYGDRVHPEEAAETLAVTVRRTVARGGVVLMPAFAVDRTPMLLHVIADLVLRERIPDVPVFVDSPMALAALDVYRDAIGSHDPQLRPELLDGRIPVMPPKLRLASTRDASERLNSPRDPCILISASGMATGGRVLHHLKHQLPNTRNTVVLTGFQVPGTRGRTLADGARAVKIHGRYVPVRAEVVSIDGFSAHADADELVAWVGRVPHPEAVYVVHGEPHASETLATRLRDELGCLAITPRFGERVRLN